jgi:tetratricopeptide (TPR) repeat protein
MNPFAFACRHRWGLSVAFTVSVTLVFAFAVTGCNRLKARDMLNKGVQAYKNAQFDQSIEFFKQAKELDPGLLNARLYLATAYASQYIPGAPSEENVRKGQQAIAEFQEVLQGDPKNLSAIDGIGSILYQMAASPYTPKKFEESRTYHLKHIALKEDDPEPYYWVGVIDWTLAFRANADLRAEYNRSNPHKQVQDEQPLPAKVREEYAAQYGEIVDDGIQKLKKAIELRPDYEDAMAYLNLLYRRRADQVATAEERESLVKLADDLVDKVKEIKQKKMEAPAKS